MEAWLEVARHIEMHYPKGTSVCMPFRPQFLASYLAPEYPIVRKLDKAAFESGEQVFIDGDFFARRRFEGGQVSPRAVAVRIWQRRGKYQAIWSVPRTKRK